MQTIINTRGLTVSRSYRDRLSQRLTKLAALWPGLVEAKVVLSKEKHRRTAGITVLAPHHTFRSEETAPDLAVAVDLAVEAVGRQVVALKERVKHRKGRRAARRPPRRQGPPTIWWSSRSRRSRCRWRRRWSSSSSAASRFSSSPMRR